MSLKQALPLPGRQQGQSWSGTIDLTILVELPPASRRIDFEVNSHDRHLARLRAVVLNRGARDKLLRFRLPIVLAPNDNSLVLAAAASRSFNSDAPADMIDRYGAAPFRIVRFRSKPSGDGRKSYPPQE